MYTYHWSKSFSAEVYKQSASIFISKMFVSSRKKKKKIMLGIQKKKKKFFLIK